MAALSAGPVQEGRWGALLRTLCPCRGPASDAEFHAKEIRGADFRPRLADRTRIEIGDLPGTDPIERDQRRALSRKGRASVRFPGRTLPRNDRRGRRRNAKG